MSNKSVHLSLASTKKNVTEDSGLNIRVNGNARSLSLFSRCDVASTLFTAGLYRSNWPTDPQSIILEHMYNCMHYKDTCSSNS